MLLRSLLTGLMATAALLGPLGRDASAQAATVRTSSPKAAVTRHQNARSEVVAPAPPGTVLDVLERDGEWYWVLLPRDENGTRRQGYIHARDLETAAGQQLNQPLTSDSGSGQADPGRRQKKAKSQKAKTEKVKIEKAESEEAQPVAETASVRKQKKADDRRLEKTKRDLERAQRDYQKVASDSSAPAK